MNEATEVNGKSLAVPQVPPRPEGRQYCDTCMYSNLVLSGNTPTTICRRRPPQVIGGILGMAQNGGVQIASQVMWPGVTREDWCGEHVPDPRGARNVVPANESSVIATS